MSAIETILRRMGGKDPRQASFWITSAAVVHAPAAAFTTTIANGAGAISGVDVTCPYRCEHFSCINAPIDITVEWELGGVSQGKEIIGAGTTVHRDVAFDTFVVTTTAAVPAGATVQFKVGE